MTSDNASNMVKAFALPGMEIFQLEEDSKEHNDEDASSYDAAEKHALSLVQGKNYGDGWGSGSRSKNTMSSMCHRADCGYDSQV